MNKKTNRALTKFVVQAILEGLTLGLFAFVVYIGLAYWA